MFTKITFSLLSFLFSLKVVLIKLTPLIYFIEHYIVMFYNFKVINEMMVYIATFRTDSTPRSSAG